MISVRAFVLAALGTFCTSACGADWPQFLGPLRNGVSSEAIKTVWPKDGPELLWKREVGEGFSGPVVSGERLILFHRVDGNEIVECLDAVTGKERWKFTYPCNYRDGFGKGDGPRSTPCIAGKHVYTLGADGDLHCLTMEDGAKPWSRSLKEDYQPRKGYFGVATSPLVDGNLLLVNVGGRGAGIVAFDKETGKEVWKAASDEASYASPVVAEFQGQKRYVFFTRTGLVMLDPTGAVLTTLRWRARYDASVNAATPLIIDDHIFLSASYSTGAILLKAGKDGVEEVWKGDEILSNHYSTSIRAGDFLYGFDGRQEEGPRFRCVEWKTGKVRWTQENFGCGSMVLADGQLIVLTEAGDLVLVEATPESYRERARAHVLNGPCRAQIALANGKLYARDSKTLVCFNLSKDR